MYVYMCVYMYIYIYIYILHTCICPAAARAADAGFPLRRARTPSRRAHTHNLPAKIIPAKIC